MDEVYVIYCNGERLDDYSYRAEYRTARRAKSTVTRLSKNEENNNEYEIRIFTNSGRTL